MASLKISLCDDFVQDYISLDFFGCFNILFLREFGQNCYAILYTVQHHLWRFTHLTDFHIIEGLGSFIASDISTSYQSYLVEIYSPSLLNHLIKTTMNSISLLDSEKRQFVTLRLVHPVYFFSQVVELLESSLHYNYKTSIYKIRNK